MSVVLIKNDDDDVKVTRNCKLNCRKFQQSTGTRKWNKKT